MLAESVKARILFAQSHDWWTWDHARIREALQAARLVHLSEVIDEALDANREKGISPATWSELCSEGRIRRDSHHLMKIRRGDHGFNDLILLGIATALGIDLHRLCPTTEEWIAQTTLELCGGRLSIEETRHYSRSRMERVKVRPQHNGAALRFGHVSVEHVVALLEPILQQIDGELVMRRKGK